MIKKGYIRTEIFKFIEDYRENHGSISIQDFFDNMNVIYHKLSSDPERPLNGMPYEPFYEVAVIMARNFGIQVRDER